MKFPIPLEFSDEDKYFKYFTKKNILALLLSGIVCYCIAKLSAALLGTMLPGLIVGLLMVLVIVGVTMLPIPETEYMKGAGLTLDVIIIRRIIRRTSRVIYIKGYSNK